MERERLLKKREKQEEKTLRKSVSFKSDDNKVSVFLISQNYDWSCKTDFSNNILRTIVEFNCIFSAKQIYYVTKFKNHFLINLEHFLASMSSDVNDSPGISSTG